MTTVAMPEATPRTSARDVAGPAARPSPLPLLIVRVRGTQEEMGAQHGRLVRRFGGYEAALRFYPEMPERLLFGNEPGVAGALVRAISKPVMDALLVRLERRRPAPYLARTRAFMEALGAPRRDARYLLVTDVFQNVVGWAGRLRLGPFAAHARRAAIPACSTLMAWGSATGDGEVRHARNFDYGGIGVWDRAPCVVLCEPDSGLRYGFLASRGADTPGVTGWNEAGIVITAHTRFGRDVSFSGLGIVDLTHEIARKAETLGDAERIAMAAQPIASTWGIAVSSAREASGIVIETDAAGVSIIRPKPGADHLVCTNRYHHEDRKRGEVVALYSLWDHCDCRESRLGEVVAAGRARGGLTSDDLEALLGDHAHAGTNGALRGSGSVISQALTVSSIVAEPASARARVSVGLAPTGWGPYATIPWTWGGEVGAEEWRGVAGPRREPFASEAHRAAYEHFVEAFRKKSDLRPDAEIASHIEESVRLSPDDPSYRLIAGLYALRALETHRALDHFEHALQNEPVDFRQGQLMLWAARAADHAGRRDRAAALRSELAATRHPYLEPHREAGAKEVHAPITAARLRRVQVDLMMLEGFV